MIILLTTANFPDVMLPAYDVNFWNCLYFVLYLILGLYLFMNLLLANVFSVYRRRLEQTAEERAELRVKTIEKFFEMHDKNDNGVLDSDESKVFFQQVMDFNY